MDLLYDHLGSHLIDKSAPGNIGPRPHAHVPHVSYVEMLSKILFTRIVVTTVNTKKLRL